MYLQNLDEKSGCRHARNRKLVVTLLLKHLWMIMITFDFEPRDLRKKVPRRNEQRKKVEFIRILQLWNDFVFSFMFFLVRHDFCSARVFFSFFNSLRLNYITPNKVMKLICCSNSGDSQSHCGPGGENSHL